MKLTLTLNELCNIVGNYLILTGKLEDRPMNITFNTKTETVDGKLKVSVKSVELEQ